LKLLNQTEFAKLAGVSKMAISKALNPKNGKEPKLDYYNGTKKIDADSVKARSYLENIPPVRLTHKIDVRKAVPQNIEGLPATEEFGKALTKTQKAQAQKIIEEAELKKQMRIEKEMKNAVRRSELIELGAVNTVIMTWFDRWLHANKRGFNASFDEFLRDAFKIFENDQNEGKKDFKAHAVTRSTLKRKWSNLFETWADDGKEASIKKLEQIKIEQAKK
jgi:transcriptional regulator with XRE-family HTH domain